MALQFCFKYVLLTFLFLFIFLLGCYNFMTNYEPNRCNMTFMYEYPQLVRISLPTNISNTYPKYGLYAYGEGRLIQKVRSMKFSGIPVLFIPGNRGSPNQVRSIASVALRKHFKDRTSYHFDFFTLDLNEEYTGLFGGFLGDQTKFASSAFEKILTLYKYDKSPTSFILIGHSMGGLIAKGLFLESNFKSEFVKIIITLASPHQPAILLDRHLSNYYARVNHYWDHNPQPNMSIVSIGGGPRDLLVKSSLTTTSHADINVITTDIPGVWLSVDHLCILWCNELVLVIARALFESVDFKTNQISNDTALRNKILRYHFVERSGSKRYYRAVYPDEVPLWGSYRGENYWTPMNSTFLNWTFPQVLKPSHITVSLATHYDLLVADAQNHETRDWIFACVVDTSVGNKRVCKTGINLSANAKILPHLNGTKRKLGLIDLSELRMKGLTHVVVRTLPTNEKVTINLELVKKRNRTLIGQTYFLPTATLISKTAPSALYYLVDTYSMAKPWNAYRLYVEALNCSAVADSAVVSVKVPWNNEGVTCLISNSAGSCPIAIHGSRPTGNEYPGEVQAHVLLNPNCSYTVRLEFSTWLNVGAIFSKVGVSTVSFIAVCLLLTLAYQIKSLEEDSSCPILHLAMPVAAKPYVVIQASALLSAVVQHVTPFFPILPTTDLQGNVGFLEIVVVPVTLCLAAFAIVYIAGIVMVVCIVFQGQAYNSVLLRFLNKFFFGLAWMSEWAMSGATKVPIVVSAFMITVAYSACGGLALFIGLGFYFFKMISLYEDFWEEIVFWPLRVIKAKIKQGKDKSVVIPKFQIPPIDEFSYHLTLLMLWALTTILHLPSVLMWAKNYRYSTKLDPDPGFMNGIILSLCVGFLWQAEIPKSKLAGSKFLCHVIFGAAVLVITFAQTTIYRIPFIISGVFVCATLHQLFGPWFTEEEEDPIPQLVDAGPIAKEGTGDLKSQITELFQASTLSTLGQELSSSASNDLPARDDVTEEGISEQCVSVPNASKGKDNVSEIEDNATPSSDASTSSFEQISDREIS